jgi:hypothetical protein
LIGENLGTHRFQRAGVRGKPVGSQSAPGIVFLRHASLTLSKYC